MIRVWSLFLLAVCLPALLLSCSRPRVDEFESSIGQISQDEIIRRFGYPQRLKKLRTGTEVWDYEFLSGNSRCVGYRIYFDEDRQSTRWDPLECQAETH